MNRKNLFKRKGGGWAVRYHVPSELRATLGKREIVRGLNTWDEGEAMIRKPEKLLEIQAEVFHLVTGREPEASIAAPVKPSPQKTTVRSKDIPQRARRTSPKIAGATQEWLRMMDGVTPHTKNRYRRSLEMFALYFKGRRVDEIERRDAIKYVRHLKATPSERTGRPLSPRSVRAEITTLSGFYKVAMHLGYFPDQMANPFRGVLSEMPGTKREKARVKSLRPITRDEAVRYLEACSVKSKVTQEPLKYAFEMQALIRLLWVTGARANEIASLLRDQIENDGDVIWIKLRNTKTEAGNRLLCLVGQDECELVAKALANADAALVTENVPKENREMLFPRLPRGGLDRKPYWNIGKTLERIRKDTFGKNVEWDMHSFRRSAVSALVNAGVPVAERNIVIGHSNKGDIGVSIYTRDGDLRKVVRRTFETLYRELQGGV